MINAAWNLYNTFAVFKTRVCIIKYASGTTVSVQWKQIRPYFEEIHHSFKVRPGCIATKGFCWFEVGGFHRGLVFGHNLSRVDNEKVLVAVTPFVFCQCEDLTKKPGRSNKVCHKRFTIVPLSPALPPLLWKHTFRPLNLRNRHRIEHRLPTAVITALDW